MGRARNRRVLLERAHMSHCDDSLRASIARRPARGGAGRRAPCLIHQLGSGNLIAPAGFLSLRRHTRPRSSTADLLTTEGTGPSHVHSPADYIAREQAMGNSTPVPHSTPAQWSVHQYVQALEGSARRSRARERARTRQSYRPLCGPIRRHLL